MLQACIFDLDGVLTDTAHYHFLAWQRLAADWGIAFTEADNERLKGVSRVESLKIILQLGNKTLSEEAFAQALDIKNQWFLEYIAQMSAADVLPGVRTFLAECQSAGLRLAVASSSKNAPLILQQIGLAGEFDAVIDGNAVVETKPHPEIFLRAAAALGLAAGDCVVFEDAEAGVTAALRAEMRVVGIGKPEILGAAHLVVSGFAGLSLAEVHTLFEA